MVRIAYLLLAHRGAASALAQARCLAATGDAVVVHLDARAPRAEHARLRAGLAGLGGVRAVVAPRPCGWGDWSLVAATLDAMRTALAAFPDASHLYLISADCLPIRPAHAIRDALAARDADCIEAHDFFDSDFIRTGLRDERLIYRHPFNERRHPGLFHAALAAQRMLGLRRALPDGLRPRIGSQWWCLRRATAERVRAFCADRPEVPRFFRSTWIPDETFFQTIVRHLVPGTEVTGRAPTFRLFTDYGMPVTFHDDHHDLLLGQDAFFARKVSAEATRLQERLRALHGDDAPPASPGGDAARLYAYRAGRGRAGARAAPAYWAPGAPSPARGLLLLACKKWHVGRRLAARLRAAVGPGADYVFDEPDADLPRPEATGPAGRRALVALLFARHGGARPGQAHHGSATQRLHLCLDPARHDVVADLAPAAGETRLLEIDCRIDDAYLAGHAARLGLAAPDGVPGPGRGADPGLLGALRTDIAREQQGLRALPGIRHFRISEAAAPQENALSLARFLDIPAAEAAPLVAAGLFDD